MRLGMIARADNGGLGNLTWEFARHLRPDRVLIMDLEQFGRSPVHVDRFDGLDTFVCHGFGPTAEARRWLIEGADVIYSAETWYDDGFVDEARAAGVRTVLHAMPELYPGRPADDLWIPTTYRRDLLPADARLVPVPVSTDRFNREVRSPARHFVHQWAPAMLDRNGTIAVLAALELITVPCKVTILGAPHNVEMSAGSPVELDCKVGPYPGAYYEMWPYGSDVLLLPRRYAGLSMPVQEAAARGMPSVMTGVPPQIEWPAVATVPSRSSSPIRMAGGTVDVHDPDPVALAATIDRLASDPGEAERLSVAAAGWADGISWATWGPRYADLLGLGPTPARVAATTMTA